MTRHGEDYDQLRGLVETFTERVGEAISQAEEVTAEDGEDPNEWRQLIARTLDAALRNCPTPANTRGMNGRPVLRKQIEFWWRRRESNPRPQMLLVKRLHA